MRAAPAVLALSAVLALAGCSLSSPSSAGSAGATASTSTATTSSSAEATARPSTSASGSAAPSVPAGHQAITAPTVGITFAVPEDWQDLNALFSQKLASTDAFYGLFSPNSRSFNSAAVAKEAEASSTPPSQAGLDEFVTQRGGTPTGYSTRQSTHGEAAIVTSTAQVQGNQTPGAVVAVPTSSGTYARIAVTAGSEQEVDTIVSTVITTAH